MRKTGCTRSAARDSEHLAGEPKGGGAHQRRMPCQAPQTARHAPTSCGQWQCTMNACKRFAGRSGGCRLALGWSGFFGHVGGVFLGGFWGLFGGCSPVLRSPLKQPPKPPKSPRNGRAWVLCGVGGVGVGEQENKDNIFIFFLYVSRLSAVFCCSLRVREQGENKRTTHTHTCPAVLSLSPLFSRCSLTKREHQK